MRLILAIWIYAVLAVGILLGLTGCGVTCTTFPIDKTKIEQAQVESTIACRWFNYCDKGDK